MSEKQESKLINCPDCDASYDISGFEEGKKFECQLCGAVVEIPVSEGEPAGGASPDRGSGSIGKRKGKTAGPRSRRGKGGGGGRSSTRSGRGGGRSGTSGRGRSAGRGRGGRQRGGGRGGRRGEEEGEEQAPRRKKSENRTAKLVFSIVIVVGVIIGLIVLLSTGDPGDDSGTQGSQTAQQGRGSGSGSSSGSAMADAGSPGSSGSSSGSAGMAGGSSDSGGMSGGSTNNSNSSNDTSDDSWGDPESAKDNENDNGGGSGSDGDGGDVSGSIPLRNSPKEWSVPQGVKSSFMSKFSNARNLPTKKLKQMREEFKNSHDLSKAIPALVDSYKAQDEWVADQAHKLLKEITHYRAAPPSPKGLSPEAKEENFDTWKKFWLYVDWEAQKQRAQKEAAFLARVEEVKPICKTVGTGRYSQKQGAIEQLRKKAKEDKVVVKALIKLLDKQYLPAVSKGANEALKKLTNQDFGELPHDAKKRFRFHQKWEQWWRNNKGSFSVN